MIQDQRSNKALWWPYSVLVLPRAQLSRGLGGGPRTLHFSSVGSRRSCVHSGKGLGCNGALPPRTVSPLGLALCLLNRSLTHPALLFRTSLGQGHLFFLITLNSQNIYKVWVTCAEEVILVLGLENHRARFWQIFDGFRSVRGRIARAVFSRLAV